MNSQPQLLSSAILSSLLLTPSAVSAEKMLSIQASVKRCFTVILSSFGVNWNGIANITFARVHKGFHRHVPIENSLLMTVVLNRFDQQGGFSGYP
ncbi:MAG: hypothetical protein RQ732_09335 [Methylophaga sp.]|nr:hypothetical protein [Methylophaga sp.]